MKQKAKNKQIKNYCLHFCYTTCDYCGALAASMPAYAKIHERNKSIIGTKLFQTNPKARNNSKNSGIIEYQKEQERINRNIDKYRMNNEDEKKWWPKYGDASAFKFRGYKRYED